MESESDLELYIDSQILAETEAEFVTEIEEEIANEVDEVEDEIARDLEEEAYEEEVEVAEFKKMKKGIERRSKEVRTPFLK